MNVVFLGDLDLESLRSSIKNKFENFSGSISPASTEFNLGRLRASYIKKGKVPISFEGSDIE
jgi:hypothetical protein